MHTGNEKSIMLETASTMKTARGYHTHHNYFLIPFLFMLKLTWLKLCQLEMLPITSFSILLVCVTQLLDPLKFSPRTVSFLLFFFLLMDCFTPLSLASGPEKKEVSKMFAFLDPFFVQ